MTGDTMLADFIAEEPSQVLQIPVSLFQSIIMTEPKAVQQVSRTVMERFREVAADPSKAAAALRNRRMRQWEFTRHTLRIKRDSPPME